MKAITSDTYSFSILFSFFLLASLLVVSACDVTSTEEDHDDDHADPWGLVLIKDGVEIAKQEPGGQITYIDDDFFELKVGEESSLITVRFLDEHGDRMDPDQLDNDSSLGWEVGNEEVLQIEQHDEDGKWSFHFVGAGAGETHIVFHLLHGDHSDFTSREFEVHVEEAVHGMNIQDADGNVQVSVDSDRNVTGRFEVNEGATTTAFINFFLDEDGNELEFDHEYELEWDIEETDIASIEKVDGEEWSFTITGNNGGDTEVHFFLVREEDSHKPSLANDDHDHEGETVVYESPHIDILVQ